MRNHRPFVIGAALLGVATLLTGCLDAGFPGPTPTAATMSPTPTPTPTTTASPTPTPTVTLAPEPTRSAGEPVSLDCGALLPIDGVYDIDPNLAVVPLSAAPSTPLAQEAVAAEGTVCQVTHGTSGALAYIGVSAPGSEALASLLAEAGASAPLGASDIEAYGSADQLQIFRGEHRISGECGPAFNPDSLRRLLELALANGA